VTGASFLPDLRIIQIGVVVRDLEQYCARHSDLTGDGPWRVYEFGPHMMTRYELHGAPADGRTLVALNDLAPQIEILQPLSGRTLHGEWLEQHGEGMHHVGVVVDSVAVVVAAAAAHGVGVLSSGEGFGSEGSGKFAYLDTGRSLGMIVEVIEPPTALGTPLRRI
jgi:methylmalonyl-CoA/ethylmalonyl-CoA epimerase